MSGPSSFLSPLFFSWPWENQLIWLGFLRQDRKVLIHHPVDASFPDPHLGCLRRRLADPDQLSVVLGRGAEAPEGRAEGGGVRGQPEPGGSQGQRG